MEENKDREEILTSEVKDAEAELLEGKAHMGEAVEEAAGQGKEAAGEVLEKASGAADEAMEAATTVLTDAEGELLEKRAAAGSITDAMGEVPEELKEAAQEAAQEAPTVALTDISKIAEERKAETPPQMEPVKEQPVFREEDIDDDDDDDDDEDEERRPKGRIIAVIIVLVLLAGAYFLGRMYFQDHFYPGTVINEYDASKMTVTELKRVMQEDLTNYNLTIKERNNAVEHILGSDIGLKYVDSDEISNLMKNQDANLWILHIFGNKYYTVSGATEYDSTKLNNKINALDCLKPGNSAPPEDACIVRRNNTFVIEPEKLGSTLDKKKTVKAITNAIEAGNFNVNLDAEECYVAPAVFSDDEELNADVVQLNELTTAHIVYDFSDRFWEVDSELIASWLVKNEEGKYYLDESLVRAWVTDMAYETDTFGLKHKFVTSYGIEIELEGGGDYGWCIDKDDTTEHLLQYIYDHANVQIQPDYLYTALDRSENDIGNTYVEVCIAAQHLWAYSDGVLIADAPVITGRVADGYATPSGSCWAIDGKKEDWQFTGYSNAHSDYWMPFNGPVGLHDADWQEPGNYAIPDYYYHYGSHGCVNMQLDTARILYQHMEIGYPVVVYYSVDQVVGPANTERLIEGW